MKVGMGTRAAKTVVPYIMVKKYSISKVLLSEILHYYFILNKHLRVCKMTISTLNAGTQSTGGR